MKLQHINPTETKAWQKLKTHFSEIEQQSIQDLFQNDDKRAEKFKIEWQDFYVDFSKNNWTEETIQLLIELANEVGLKDAISKYFSGEKINETENRAVLHTALRANENEVVLFEGENVMPEIFNCKNKIKDFTNKIVSGEAKGYSGKAFTDVVNIGIGGSDLGPAMIVEALQFYKNNFITQFISHVDGEHLQ